MYQVNTLSMILCILCYKNGIIGGLYLVSLCVKNLQPSFKIKKEKYKQTPRQVKRLSLGLNRAKIVAFSFPMIN